MAKWKELDLSGLKMKIDALRSATEGTAQRGRDTVGTIFGAGGMAMGQLNKLADTLQALGAEKRGFEQEEKMEGIRQKGLTGRQQMAEDAAKRNIRIAGQETRETDRAGEEFKRSEAVLDRASREYIAEMRGGGESVTADRMEAAYNAAWNAVTTAHPEMWETGQFEWRRDSADLLEREFRGQLRRFSLPAEKEEILMKSFVALLETEGPEVDRKVVPADVVDEIGDIISNYKSTTFRQREGAWAADLREDVEKIDELTPEIDMTPALNLVDMYTKDDIVLQENINKILEVLGQLIYGTGITQPVQPKIELEEPPPGFTPFEGKIPRHY